MAVVDYDKKIEDAIEDFGIALARYMRVQNDIDSGLFELEETDTDRTRFAKRKGIETVMIDFGNIAELSLKYFLKLKRIELFPNEAYDDGTRSSFKEKMKISSGTINELISKVHGTDADKAAINAARDKDTTGHNFDVVYTIIDRLFPEVKNQMNEMIKLKKLSEYGEFLLEEIYKVQYDIESIENLPDNIKEEFYHKNSILKCFPKYGFYRMRETSYFKKGIDDYISDRITNRENTINYSGDIFTKLRYFSNHASGYSYNFDELFFLADELLLTNSIMERYGNDINANPEVAYAYYTLINHPEYTKYNKDEIEFLFKHKKLKENPKAIYWLMFGNTKLSVDEIKEILKDKGINPKDYADILTNNLNLKAINYFRNIGIEDYNIMKNELTIGIFSEENLISHLLSCYSSIEEYDEKRKKQGLEYKELLKSKRLFSKEAYETIREYPEILEYYNNRNFEDCREYYFNQGFLNALLEIDELRENPSAWGGLDVNQMITYKYSRYALEPHFKANNEYDKETIINNIKENIENFKEVPELLENIPLMLDPTNNLKIYEILKRHNASDEEIKGFNSTIFCLPSSYIESFEITNQNIIKNGKLNPRIIDKISRKFNGNDFKEVVNRDIFHNGEYIYDMDIKKYYEKYCNTKKDMIRFEMSRINNSFSSDVKKKAISK